MKSFYRALYPSILVFLVVLLATPIASSAGTYIENFTTTQYKDTLNTTAWWDTVAGELKLFPFQLTPAGTYDTPGSAYDVYISGDYAFVADGLSGLQVIDITNPAAPTLAGTYDTPSLARGVCVSGNHAYVANDQTGLVVIDITNPAAPALTGSYDTPAGARSVCVSGDHAFVAVDASGLTVIDITDPSAPSLAGSYLTPSDAWSVDVSGDHAFVACAESGVQVLDISDPTTPSLVGAYVTSSLARRVCVSGDHAYVANYFLGLEVIDVSDPTAPVLAGSYDTPGWTYGVYVSGDRAYMGDGYSGLQVIDVSDPTTPTLFQTHNTPGFAWSVFVSGDHAYVADSDSGFQVVKIANPVPPALLGTYDTPGSARAVYVSGHYAFVADQLSGLQVIDITNPAAPALAGTYDTPDRAEDVFVSGNHAFVADGSSGLQVIDVSDPTVPALAGSYDMPGVASGVYVAGDHVYVASAGLLTVVDISNPATPTEAGRYITPGTAMDVYVSGNHAFVADGSSGLEVIDVSDPATPVLAGAYDTPGSAEGVWVSGDYAFVADWDSGFHAVDISNPAAPSLLGTYGSPGYCRDACVSGDYALVANSSSGVIALDVSDPTAPTLVETRATTGAMDVCLSGEHAFVCAQVYGLKVFQVYQSEVDTDNNEGRSLAVNTSDETIVRARLQSTQTSGVSWELSADGGTNWQGTVAGAWDRLSPTGVDLMWRSTHNWASPGGNPSVSQLQVDWAAEAAAIDSIVDVPDDQGGWVFLHFTRSGYDFADESETPVSAYNIHLRVGSEDLIADILSKGQQVTNIPTSAAGGGNDVVLFIPPGDECRLVEFAGSYYLVTDEALAAPPGVWAVVATVFAQQQHQYIAMVPTVGDSSETVPYSHYYISAHTTTPSVFFDSPVDSGYSVGDIPPAVPTNFAAAYNTGSGNQLTWDPCPDDDFDYFCVYRSNDPAFVPTPLELVHVTTGTNWSDPDYDGWNVHYKITAVDIMGNESDPASPETMTGVDDATPPTTFALYQNVPNPFNPTTVIRYDVPAPGGHVTIRVYDVAGGLVRTLVDAQQSAGVKQVTWHGRDHTGARVATGVYFYWMTAPGYEQTRKIVLIQ